MLVGLDWVKSMIFLLLHVIYSCIFHVYVPLFSILLILIVFGTLLRVSLSLSPFLLDQSVHGTQAHVYSVLKPSSFQGIILLLYMLGFVMRRPRRTSRRIFLDVAFIRNTRSFFCIFSILTYPLSFTVGVGSPFVTSQLVVLP